MNNQDIIEKLSDIDTLCYGVITLVKNANISNEDEKTALINDIRSQIYEITDKTSDIKQSL